MIELILIGALIGGQDTATVLAPLRPQVADADQTVDQDVTRVDDIVVMGRRGAAQVAAETVLEADAIDAIGAYDIGEVIRRLTEDYALGEAPLVIVNGRRMADPDVFSGFPPDALVRIEVLPAQGGALYGTGDPSRRVVNIVLQRRFHSRDGRVDLRRPTAGGRSEANGDLSQSTIIESRTRRLGLRVGRDTALRAGDRPARSTGEPGDGAVTLRPASATVAADLGLTGAIGDWSTSLNANAQADDSRSVSRLAGETVQSRRRSRGLNVTGGASGDLAGWSTQLSLNGRLSQGEQSGLAPSDNQQRAATASLTLGRALLDLPAGVVTANLSARASESRTESSRPEGRRTVSGRSRDLSGSVSVPLARRGTEGEGIGRLGDLSLSLGATLNATDAGRGEGVNASLAWAPLPKLRITANGSTSTLGLSDAQRFEPESIGEPIVVFDFRRGEAVQVSPILGGNPNLQPPSLEQMSLSASAGPFTAWGLQGGTTLQRTNAIDGIGGLPDPTTEVEAVFPDRFRRDVEGRLVSLDRRPINFASALTEILSTNLAAAIPLGGGTGTGLLRVTIGHSVQLTNMSAIVAGLPETDRLQGDGGGAPRHQLNLAVDGRRGAWGVNLAARWRDGYRIRRDNGQDGPDDLRQRSLGTVDLRFSRRFERAVPGGGTRRGVGRQLDIEITNLFDARPRARLGDGRPAPGYARDDQDPLGRSVQISLRQRF